MENDKMKTPRASESRVSEKRPTTWTPPSSLDAPAPKDGYVHRWIRLEILGTDDTKNVSSKLRSGWELVRADEYPGQTFSTIESGKYAGIIGHGGLALARIPKRLQMHVRNITSNKRKTEKKLSITTYLRISTQVCLSIVRGRVV
jgi:hypothetical protein